MERSINPQWSVALGLSTYSTCGGLCKPSARVIRELMISLPDARLGFGRAAELDNQFALYFVGGCLAVA